MENEAQQTTLKHRLTVGLFALFAIIVFGLLWLFFLSPSNPSGFGWFLFSFAAGLSMIVLPCTLPLAFVIVPLSMGKGVSRGLGIALAFGLGVATTLSLYGVIAALVGKVAVGTLGAPLEEVKNWVYFIAGFFAYMFALAEIGLVKFRMPSYTGAAPVFIQKRKDLAKAFFLGLFLGNIGVGCPHPATPLILVEIATKGNVLYGWSLFFVHAIGRVLPLLFLAALGILGVNGLSWLVARKEKVEKATGWAMVFVAGFILVLGVFTHKWWVNSGIHTQLEKITQEERLLNIVKENLNSDVTHAHGVETGTGILGLPLSWGNWALVGLWVAPMWVWWYRRKKDIKIISESETVPKRESETKILMSKKFFIAALTILLGLVFIYILPHNFLNHQSADHHGHAPGTPADHPHDNGMMSEGMMDHHMDDMMMGGEHAGHATAYHEEGDVQSGFVNNFTAPQAVTAGVPVDLKFFVNLLPQKTPVLNLDIEHEKFMHVIGVRDDLSNFFHIHPENAGNGVWSVRNIFKEAGAYKVWSDVTYQGTTHSFGHKTFDVGGAEREFSPTRYIEFFKNVVVEKYQVGVTHPEPIVMGLVTPIDFSIRDFTGNGIDIEQYLGADMHLAVIKDDLSVYMHKHPEDHGHGGESDGHDHFHSMIEKIIPKALANGTAPGDEKPAAHISFNVNFPEPGIYKLFAQFRPKGVALPADQSLVAEFFVRVLETGPEYPAMVHDHGTSTTVNKGLMIIISLMFIALLGWGSYKFINVKQ